MQFVSDGKYQTTAPFTMRGGWRIEVVITRGGEKQSVFFDVLSITHKLGVFINNQFPSGSEIL